MSFKPGDKVVLKDDIENFPAFGRGPWKVEKILPGIGGDILRLGGFNDFHESWFQPHESRTNRNLS